ncbi:unnamed protein product [Arctogadus glacialis]
MKAEPLQLFDLPAPESGHWESQESKYLRGPHIPIGSADGPPKADLRGGLLGPSVGAEPLCEDYHEECDSHCQRALSSPSIFIMTAPDYGSCDLPQHGPGHGDIGQIPPRDQSSSPYTHSRGPVVQSAGEGAGERGEQGDRGR